jgi:hypothetical protein
MGFNLFRAQTKLIFFQRQKNNKLNVAVQDVTIFTRSQVFAWTYADSFLEGSYTEQDVDVVLAQKKVRKKQCCHVSRYHTRTRGGTKRGTARQLYN